MKYFVWTVGLWLAVSVLAIVSLLTFRCANPSGCIGLNGGPVAFVLVFFIGLPLYVIGMLAMLLWDWMRRPRKPKVASGPPGREQGW